VFSLLPSLSTSLLTRKGWRGRRVFSAGWLHSPHLGGRVRVRFTSIRVRVTGGDRARVAGVRSEEG